MSYFYSATYFSGNIFGTDDFTASNQISLVVLDVYRASSGNRQNRTSLSVLSPFNEEEEWTKIVEMLNSCNSGLQSVSDGSGGDDSHLLGAVQREFQNILGEFRLYF